MFTPVLFILNFSPIKIALLPYYTPLIQTILILARFLTKMKAIGFAFFLFLIIHFESYFWVESFGFAKINFKE